MAGRPPKNKITIIIADDDEIFLEGLHQSIKHLPNIHKIHKAKDGFEVLEIIKKHRIDIVLMDCIMPKLNGYETTEEISKNHATVKVIGISFHDENSSIDKMFKAGAVGYLVKGDTASNTISLITKALESVMNGETCFEPKAANLIIAEMIHETDNHGQKIKLTKKETAVLNYAAKGNSIKMTADKLGLSPRTIETHRNNMFKKTGAANITELIAWGRKNGYLED